MGKEELVKVLTKALGVLEERENAKKQDETSRIQEHKLSSFLEDSEYSALLSGKLYGQSASQTYVSSTNTFSEVTTLMVKFYNTQKSRSNLNMTICDVLESQVQTEGADRFCGKSDHF